MSRARGRSRANVIVSAAGEDPGADLYTVEGDGIFKTVRRAPADGAVIWPTSKTGASGIYYFETTVEGDADAEMQMGFCNADFTAAEGPVSVNTININETDVRVGGVSVAHAALGLAGPRGIVTRWVVILSSPQWAIAQAPASPSSPVGFGGMTYTTIRPYWRFTTAADKDWTGKILTKSSNFIAGLPGGATAWDAG